MGFVPFVSASDLHGDRKDDIAVKLFFRFVDDFKPKVRVFKGDIWDFRAIREGAAKDEKQHSMREDFKAGMKFIERYQPNVITLGNHDQRLWDLVRKNGVSRSGPLTDLAVELIEKFEKLTKKLGTIVLPYDKRKGVWSHNGLKFTHGFSQGKNAASEMASAYGNVLFGHIHAIDVASEPEHDQPRIARSVGCLCQLDMTYNRSQISTLRQQHGWAYGAFIDRSYEVFQAAVHDAQVIYADHLKMIRA